MDADPDALLEAFLRVHAQESSVPAALYARGVQMDTSFEQLNLSRPEVVAEVHRAYVEAGAEMIETNTFAANRYKMADVGQEDQVAAINRRLNEAASSSMW